MVGFCI